MSGTTPGALYELVNRGQKDLYFISEKGISPFSATYEKQPARLAETRRQVPTNYPAFGRSLEFEIDFFGDVLTDAALIVELPSLLSPQLPLTASSGLVPAADSLAVNYFRDSSGSTYGYTSGAAYYLFERIQLFQDKILIQDITGDSLLAIETTNGSYGSGRLLEKVAGIYDESDPRQISHSMSPPSYGLRVKLPFPGCQAAGDGGFPICTLREPGASVWRLRLTMRKLEDILLAYDSSSNLIRGPSRFPFGKTLHATDINGLDISCTCLQKEALKLNVMLETTQLYLEESTISKMQQDAQEIPFVMFYDQEQSYGPIDYLPVDRGAKAYGQIQIDGRHPVHRLVFFYRLQLDLENGRRNPHLTLFESMKFLIAGQDREKEWPTEVWNGLYNYYKNDREFTYYVRNYYYHMNWSLGSQFDNNAVAGERRPRTTQPEGSVNLSSADKPTLAFNLSNLFVNEENNIVTQTTEYSCEYQTYKTEYQITDNQLRYTELKVCCQSWAVYIIENGRARLMFHN
jgi:hypothetical protein